MLKKESKIFVAGHRGLVGSAIYRKLLADGYTNIVVRTRQELDLMDQHGVYSFLQTEKPDVVIMAAAKVGGIHANSTYPADFIGLNLTMEANLIWGAHLADVAHFQFLGSSCIYPRETNQPIPENSMLTGKPEPTNAPYAMAKIAGLTMCEAISNQYDRNYYTVIPPNIYGPGDNYDLSTSHVMPALIRKFHEAKEDNHRAVECWGTGRAKREFLYSEDVADACIFLMNQPRVTGHINVGTGTSISVFDLAHVVQKVIGHEGEIRWNSNYPDGFPEKTMDVSRLYTMGWRPRISLEQGIGHAYENFKESLLAGTLR